MMETIVDIYEMSGTSKNRSYTKVYSNVKTWIVPASNESIALYDGMPQGQEYSFRILPDYIPAIKEQSKFIVKDSQLSGFSTGDVFITVVGAKRQRIMAKFYHTGMCYKSV